MYTDADLEYIMLSNEFDYDELVENAENFGVKRFKDAVYRGEINQQTKKRKGRGVICKHLLLIIAN